MGYFAPTSLIEALQVLAQGPVQIVAGGTDFFPGLQNKPPPRELLDLTRISEMQGITRSENGWRIGACARWTDIVNAALPPCFDGLKAAARDVGSVQIQNVGTVAGNLCNASPAADGVPPLLTLDATVELQSATGSRILPLADFITGVRKIALQQGELVVAVHIPNMPTQAQSSFEKLGSRRYLVISIAMVAVVLALDDAGQIETARVAVGSCSPVAQRLPVLEADLIGLDAAQLAGFEVSSKHLVPLSPIADVRGSAEYRIGAVAELCKRALVAACEKGRGHG